MKSGREDLPVSERIGLLRADLMAEPFLGISEASIASSQTIHDLKLTRHWIMGKFELYEAAVARGQTDETLAKGANWFLTNVECYVLAWRRGGHLEFQKVLKQSWDEDRPHGSG